MVMGMTTAQRWRAKRTALKFLYGKYWYACLVMPDLPISVELFYLGDLYEA